MQHVFIGYLPIDNGSVRHFSVCFAESAHRARQTPANTLTHLISGSIAIMRMCAVIQTSGRR
jgi:hypothetical protein